MVARLGFDGCKAQCWLMKLRRKVRCIFEEGGSDGLAIVRQSGKLWRPPHHVELDSVALGAPIALRMNAVD